MWKNVVAPTILVIVFWGLSSIATAYYIKWLEGVPERMVLEDLSTIHAADQMRYTLGMLFRSVANSKRPWSPEVAEEIKRVESVFLSHFHDAVATATSPEEVGIDRKIKSRFDDFCREIARQGANPAASDGESLDDLRRLMRMTGDISTLENSLGEMNGTLMKDLAASRSTATRSLTAIRYALLIIGPAAGILFGFWISRRFHRSISQISITLNDVASEMREHVGRVNVRQSRELPHLQEQVNVVVTRIREVIQQLNEARQQAISGARLAAVGEMAAGVAHELRNPLTSVKLLIQTGAQRLDRPLTDRQFRVVLEEISRMETTIERMLDFARPPRMNRMRHDVRDIVSRALSLVEGRAQHGGVEIISQIPSAPVDVNVDAEQLHQVFSNLLQNAIEAMPGGGMLHVNVQRQTARQLCRVSFEDTGPGISADVLKRIFEPFVTDKARGTGLGLAVSYRIVGEHGGQLTAENQPQRGAVFTVELPLLAPHAVDDAPLTAESTHAEVAHH